MMKSNIAIPRWECNTETLAESGITVADCSVYNLSRVSRKETLLLYEKDKNSCDASRFCAIIYFRLSYLHDLGIKIPFDICIIYIKLKSKTDEG